MCMLYFYGAIVAFLIVLGQVLLKFGVQKYDFELTEKFIFSDNLIKSLSSPFIIFGIISYGIATILFMALLNKYEYTSLQAVVVSSSLFCTLLAASVLFNEKLSILNLIGFLILIIGVVLVTKF